MNAPGEAPERRAPVQQDRGFPCGSVEWAEHVEAWEAYAARFGRTQSAERIAERGGFGYEEMRVLLGRPLRTWRPRAGGAL